MRNEQNTSNTFAGRSIRDQLTTSGKKRWFLSEPNNCLPEIISDGFGCAETFPLSRLGDQPPHNPSEWPPAMWGVFLSDASIVVNEDGVERPAIEIRLTVPDVVIERYRLEDDEGYCVPAHVLECFASIVDIEGTVLPPRALPFKVVGKVRAIDAEIPAISLNDGITYILQNTSDCAQLTIGSTVKLTARMIGRIRVVTNIWPTA